MGVETTKFIRKALYVDAVRVNANNFDDLVAWCSGEVQVDETPGSGTTKKYIKVRVHNPKNPRQTKAFIGDWLLYTERGYKVYTNRAFRQAFDEVKDGIAVPQQVEAPKPPVRQEIPKFYFAPHSDELTETKPHKNAVPLTLDELMNIIRNELVGEELQNTTRPEPEPVKEPLPPQPRSVGAKIEIPEFPAEEPVVEEIKDPEIRDISLVTDDPETTPGVHPIESVTKADNESPEMKAARETIEAEGGTVEPATSEAIAEVVEAQVPVEEGRLDSDEIIAQVQSGSEAPKGIDTAGKRVLSENEQKVLGPDEVRKLILAGDVILAQDLEPAEQS